MRKSVFNTVMAILVAVVYTVNGCGPSDSSLPDVTKVLVMSPHYEFERAVEVFPLNMEGLEFTPWDVADSTPTQGQLNDFDVVLLFANSSSENDSNVANAVHDYVLDGGNVVLATFYYYYRGDGYWGRMESIDPVIGSLNVNNATYDTLIFDTNHPLRNGIDTLITEYHPTGYSVRPGATLIASYNNGNWFAAYNKPNGRILAINAFPTEFDYGYVPRIEFFRLWENALLFAAWGQTSDRPSDNVVPDVPLGGGGEAKAHKTTDRFPATR